MVISLTRASRCLSEISRSFLMHALIFLSVASLPSGRGAFAGWVANATLAAYSARRAARRASASSTSPCACERTSGTATA